MERRTEMTLTGDVQTSLKHLVHGLGVLVVVREQLGPAAHHGPSSAVFHLEKMRDRMTERGGHSETSFVNPISITV